MLDIKDKKTALDLMICGAGILFVGFVFWGAPFELIGGIVFVMGLGEYIYQTAKEKQEAPHVE